MYSRGWLWRFPSRVQQNQRTDWHWYLGQHLGLHTFYRVITGTVQFILNLSIGAISELVTQRLNFLSQLPQVLHVVIKDIAHLEVKSSVWYKRLFVQQEYLLCCQKHTSIKTSCGLNWQMWMLLWCSSLHVMGHLCIYVSGRQRFNVISPGSRGTVYAGNPSGEVPFLRRGMMIAVIINTALCNPSWFLLMQAVMLSQRYLQSILSFLMLILSVQHRSTSSFQQHCI